MPVRRRGHALDHLEWERLARGRGGGRQRATIDYNEASDEDAGEVGAGDESEADEEGDCSDESDGGTDDESSDGERGPRKRARVSARAPCHRGTVVRQLRRGSGQTLAGLALRRSGSGERWLVLWRHPQAKETNDFVRARAPRTHMANRPPP